MDKAGEFAEIKEQLRGIQAVLGLVTKPRAELLADARRLLAAFLAGRNANTAKGYAAGLRDFTAYLKAGGVEEGVAHFLGMRQGAVNETLEAYQKELRGRGLAPSSVNRNLAVVSALLKHARRMGLAITSVEIMRVKREAVKDTTGPEPAQVARVLRRLGEFAAVAACERTYRRPSRRFRLILCSERRAARDAGLIAVLFYCGLRVSEALGLDYPADVDLAGGRLRILGKARTTQEWIPIPGTVKDALSTWLDLRPSTKGCPARVAAGPLFVALRRSSGRKRMAREDAWRMIHGHGLKRPHGLRHAAALAAVEKGANVLDVSRFLRHKNISTTSIYLNGHSEQAQRKVADLLTGARVEKRVALTVRPARVGVSQEAVAHLRALGYDARRSTELVRRVQASEPMPLTVEGFVKAALGLAVPAVTVLAPFADRRTGTEGA